MEQEISNLKINVMALTKDISYIKESLDTHIKDQKEHDIKVEDRLEKTNVLVSSHFKESQKTMVDFIESADNKYADAEQFRFWRNLLITGIILSVLVGVAGIIVDKILHSH